MKDYEYELSMILQQKLKKVIKGRIFVNVFRDTLVVQVTNPNNYEWEYRLERFSEMLLTGDFNTSDIARDIIREYKHKLITMLFDETIYADGEGT